MQLYWYIVQEYSNKYKGDNRMNKLRESIKAKTKYDVSDMLYHEALEAAKVEIKEHQVMFNRRTKAEKLEYVECKMAVYCLMVILRV